jgi:PAS domain S-box-containing protein
MEHGVTEATIKLGLMPPLTGLVGIYGTEIARAGLIACQEVNQDGGVLGRPLELMIEDDGSLPESAVTAAENLVIRDQCSAIIGNLLSNSRIAVAYRVAEPRKVPYLNFSFYEGSIVSRYFFHFAALPNQQIDRMIPYMRERFGPRMFFAGNNYEWSRGSIHAGKLALERVGGVVIGEEYCPLGVDEAVIESLLDQVEEASPDVFVPYFAGADQLTLLTQFTERGLKKHIAVVMGHYDEVMASNLSAEIREGFFSSNTYFMTVDTPSNHDFLARLAKFPEVTGVWPHGNGTLTNFSEGAYICVKAFAKAANLAGSVEPEALVEVLKTIDVDAPQGTVQMNPQHHHARVNTYLSRCGADGVFDIVESFGTLDPILPERYSHQVIKQSATLEEDMRLQARILELMPEAVFIVSMTDKSVVYASGSAERMFGYGIGELLGLPITQLCESPDVNTKCFFDDDYADLTRKGGWNGEIHRVEKNGSGGICSLSISIFTHPVHDEVWLFVATDITERKIAETALKESEERYAFAISGTNDGLWDWNIEANSNYMSPRFKEILGYRDSELENKVEVFFNALHPDDAERVTAEVQAHFKEYVPFNTEYRLRRKKGDYVWIHAKGQAVRSSDGTALRMAGSISDISKRKQAERATKESEDRLKEILKIAPEAVITIGGNMKIQLFNKGAERIFGYTVNEVLGQSMDILMPERLRQGHRRHIDGFEGSSDTYRFMDQREEIIGLRKDGSEFPASASVSKLEIGNDKIFTVMLHDITERRRAEIERREALNEAEQANKAKSEFLASMSHELRTPLNAILGFSDILSHEYLGPIGLKKYVEYANDIHASGSHLLSLVNDILDISSIEAGKTSLNIKTLNFKEIANESMVIVANSAETKGIKLIDEIPYDLPLLSADGQAIKQILLNLMANAIKFTPKGGSVTLSAKASKTTFGVVIEDTGLGISKEKLPEITKPFTRSVRDPHKTVEGWGLGLAITKSLIDLHEGSLDISSTVGKGTTVVVTLPNNQPQYELAQGQVIDYRIG